MATSPTVLADASISSPPASVPAAAAPKVPILPLLIAVVAGVLIAALGIGGAVYYLARTGRLPAQGSASQKVETAPISTHAVVLEPLLVNLADAGGSSYLRVALTLRVADATDKNSGRAKNAKSKDDKDTDDTVASIRDTVLTVLGRQTADVLLADGGKEHLKAELKTALAAHESDVKVKDVFFTDFLVQR